MCRPVAKDRNATTSACVGWDIRNIENQPGLRKKVPNGSRAGQNGLTITRITMPIIRTVGISLIIL
jgi:hypothetical protein